MAGSAKTRLSDYVAYSAIGTVFVFGLYVPVGLVVIQTIVFLRSGVWHWLSNAEVLAFLGADPLAIERSLEPDRWLGVSRLVHWLLSDLWRSWVGITSLLLAALGLWVSSLVE